jgi:DNA repair ATPase RecN
MDDIKAKRKELRARLKELRAQLTTAQAELLKATEAYANGMHKPEVPTEMERLYMEGRKAFCNRNNLEGEIQQTLDQLTLLTKPYRDNGDYNNVGAMDGENALGG